VLDALTPAKRLFMISTGTGLSAANRWALAAVRLHTRTRRSGRTARIAARWVRAWTPAPRMARSPALSRASARVATPLHAAVRIAVMLLASMIASG